MILESVLRHGAPLVRGKPITTYPISTSHYTALLQTMDKSNYTVCRFGLRYAQSSRVVRELHLGVVELSLITPPVSQGFSYCTCVET